MTFVKTLIFTILVPGTVTIYVPYRLLYSRVGRNSISIDSLNFIGIIPIVFGALVYLWCAWDFTFAGQGTPAPIDPPRKLVVRGLYKFTRNPMYVGVLSILLGEGILFESRILFEYAGWAFVFFYLFVVFYEEPTLRRKFGESYEIYCRSVPRWIGLGWPKDSQIK